MNPHLFHKLKDLMKILITSYLINVITNTDTLQIHS